jgi:hypothetical protein
VAESRTASGVLLANAAPTLCVFERAGSALVIVVDPKQRRVELFDVLKRG